MSTPVDTDKLKFDALYSFSAFKALVRRMIVENTELFDAFLLAAMAHVLLLPVLWCLGWALPWPKSPVVTSVIEIDLQAWPNMGKAKKLYEFRDPELNE